MEEFLNKFVFRKSRTVCEILSSLFPEAKIAAAAAAVAPTIMFMLTIILQTAPFYGCPL